MLLGLLSDAILVFGHTHRAGRTERWGTVPVNPGSPR